MISVQTIEEMISVAYKDQLWNTPFNEKKLKKLLAIEDKSEKIKTKEELEKLLDEIKVICSNDYKEKVETEYKDLYIQPMTGKHYLKIGKKISPVPLPEVFVLLIKQSVDKGIDASPLIKCFSRFLRNPRFIKEWKRGVTIHLDNFARYISLTYVDPKKKNELMKEQGLNSETASKLATTREIDITKEGILGCFKTSSELLTKWEYNEETGEKKEVQRHNLTKKVFNADTGEFEIEELADLKDIKAEDRVFYPFCMGLSGGTPWTCKGSNGYGDKPVHFFKVGCVHTLKDEDIDVSDHMTASFYVGSLNYISNWGGADIHQCLVDPMHITGFLDYNGSMACKTKEFYINGSLTAVNHSIYHSSEYAAKTDLEWIEAKKEILKNLGELKQESEENVESEIEFIGNL